MAKGRRFLFRKIIIVVATAIVVYVGFLYSQLFYYTYRSFIKPTVISDAEIHNAAYPVLYGWLPEQSHHLYYARKGFEQFLGFSLNSQKECEEYLEHNFDAPVRKFIKSSDLSAYPAKSGPQTWGDKYKDPNWQIDRETSFYFYEHEKMGRFQIAYIPDKCRMYFFRGQD